MKVVILEEESGKRHLVDLKADLAKIGNFGVLDLSRINEEHLGRSVSIGGKLFRVLPASIIDKLEMLRRKAQIILPKDSASIILNCNIKSGDVVVEGGTGSGALTIVLAHFVSPTGRVVSYEKRKDHLSLALSNVKKADLEEYCEFKRGDITKELDERGVDAVVLDIPEPWFALDPVYQALKPGGHFGSYLPTMNQVANLVLELRKMPFINVRTVEILEREIEVSAEGGVRPSFEMLGHTGYITFARKVAASAEKEVS